MSQWIEGDIVANGIKQHYYRTANAQNKPQIIFLHGFMLNSCFWKPVVEILKQDFDLILVDARGHGFSNGPIDGFSTDLLAEDVVAFIKELKLNQPFLLGHSMGAGTAALVAATSPDLVHAMVLEDPALATPANINNPGFQEWQNSLLQWIQMLKTMPTAEERLVSAQQRFPQGRAGWSEDEFVVWVEAQAQLNLDIFKFYSLNAAVLDWRGVLSRISCPILLMTGNPKFGGAGSPQNLEMVIGSWNNGEHVHFENAGHNIHSQQFDRYMAIVNDFLKRHTTPVIV